MFDVKKSLYKIVVHIIFMLFEVLGAPIFALRAEWSVLGVPFQLD